MAGSFARNLAWLTSALVAKRRRPKIPSRAMAQFRHRASSRVYGLTFGLEHNCDAQRADDNPLSFGTVVKGSKCEPRGGKRRLQSPLNRRLDCSAVEIRVRWRAHVNQPSMQSARPLHADGGAYSGIESTSSSTAGHLRIKLGTPSTADGCICLSPTLSHGRQGLALEPQMMRILFLLTSARSILLTHGSSQETGFFAADALKPYDCFTAAGAEIAVATVDGKPPQLDPYGLEPIFYYPDEDVDFLASMTRAFMRDAEDIRITLEHVTELELIAARRIFEALKRAHMRGEEARILIERTARKAWSETANFVILLSSDSEIAEKLSVAQLRECADAVRTDAKKRSDSMRQRLSTIPQFQDPLKLSDLSDEEMLEYDVVFIPGGYGPMVDLPDNADVRRLLRLMHDRSRVIAALGHGPAALLSAPHRADGLWLFDGYRMTAFTDEEEDQTHLGKLGMPWYLEAALKNRGAVFDDALAAWTSHVVVDRNLITGQNPASANSIAHAVLKRVAVLGRNTV
jgi:putative intracellular protease/amidase